MPSTWANSANLRRSYCAETYPELSIETIRTCWRGTARNVCIWQEISHIGGARHQLNHTNGELVQMKLRHISKRWQWLSKAVNRANLYGPDGQTSFSPGSGRSLGSV